jgi:ATP-binding cassette subfamily B protein
LAEATRDPAFVYGINAIWHILPLRLAGLGAFGVLAWWRWWAPFLVAGAYMLLSRFFAQWSATLQDDLLETTGGDRRRATYLRGLLTGTDEAKEVRLFGLTGWLVARYAAVWRGAMEVVWRNRGRSLRPILAACGVVVVAIGGVLALLAHDVTTGSVAVAGVVTLVQAMLGLQAFGVLGDLQTQFGRNGAAVRGLARLRSDLGLPELDPVAVSPGRAAPASGAAAVAVESVTFAYPSRDQPAVRDLSLRIPAGQATAIVGVNGAGKSTLIKLLCGLYPPGAGRVRVDGGDPFADEAVRRRVAVIFQDFARYQLSMRDNVGFGALAHRDDVAVLERALTDAGGDDVLAGLSNGWDTVLSAEYEGGRDLSGGQWQRIALARALAAVAGGAGVLVLDEPTAALDVRAEAALFDRFLQVTRGVTTILVSHRLSSVRHADRIVVLDPIDGIVEDGAHEELMAAGGRYARMFSLQARRFGQAGGVG